MYTQNSLLGVERFNNYSGYGEDFTWEGDHIDQTPFDDNKRRRTAIVAIDALHFARSKDQFYPSAILRELNKAYVGFHSRESSNLAPIATGNWGCGAFQGDKKLKFLIQLMACVVCKRDMVYFTFGDIELQEELDKMHKFLVMGNVSISNFFLYEKRRKYFFIIFLGQLWRYLCQFSNAKLSGDHLFSFICQTHLDSSQVTENNVAHDLQLQSEPSTSTSVCTKTFATNESTEVFDPKPKHQFTFRADTNKIIDVDSSEPLRNGNSPIDGVTSERSFEPMDVTSSDNSKNVCEEKPKGAYQQTGVKAERKDEHKSTNSSQDCGIPAKSKITDYFERKFCK